MKTARQRTLLLLALLATAIFPSCQQVKPWQRGTLAKPVMLPDRDALSLSVSEHMWFTREAISGGRSVGGGGCGCN